MEVTGGARDFFLAWRRKRRESRCESGSEGVFAGSLSRRCRLGHGYLLVVGAELPGCGLPLGRTGLFSFVDGFGNYVAGGQTNKQMQEEKCIHKLD